jgi:hypothetical protein
LRRTSLILVIILMVMLLVLAGLAGAPVGVIPGARAQYATDGQYGAGGQYAAPSGSTQSGAAPNSSCEQDALNALSSPNLGSNTSTDNHKLLEQYVKCGGTISALPQESFNTLLMQGVIELDVVNSSSGFVGCPSGDKSHCSDIPG